MIGSGSLNDHGEIAVRPLDASFSGWQGLLALILRAFAPMQGVIDPPSSALRLTPESLREKAGRATVLDFKRFAMVFGP